MVITLGLYLVLNVYSSFIRVIVLHFPVLFIESRSFFECNNFVTLNILLKLMCFLFV